MIQRVRPGVVRVVTDLGIGSGVIYSRAAGGGALVLTNYHVIEGGTKVDVVVRDSSTYPATIRGIDAGRDLAVLEICCAEFTVVPLGSTDDLGPGNEIVVIGYALGIEGQATVTTGIVSALRYESDAERWVIQTDAPINPGNSGGPMLSASGEVVGIATYKRVGRLVEGVGFAVAEKTFRGLLPILSSGEALAFPTPTPPPQLKRYLKINGLDLHGGQAIVYVSGGQVHVDPPPDDDGSYPANTRVILRTYNDAPRRGGAITGADNVDSTGVTTVIMNADRSVEVIFY